MYELGIGYFCTWRGKHSWPRTTASHSFSLSLSCASRVHSIHFIRFVYFTTGIIYFNFNWFQSILLFTFNYNSVFPCHRTPSHIAFVHNTCFEREIEQTKLYSLFYIINCLLFMFNGNYFMCVITSTAHTWCYWNSFRQAAGGYLVGSFNSFWIIAYSMTLAMNTFKIDMNQLDLRARYLLFRFWSILSRFYSIKRWIKLNCGLKHQFQMEEYQFNTFKIEHSMALCGRQHKTIIKSIYFWYEQINLSQEKGQSINYFMKCKNKWLAKSSLKHHTFWGIHWVHFAASHLRLSRIMAWTYFYLVCKRLHLLPSK